MKVYYSYTYLLLYFIKEISSPECSMQPLNRIPSHPVYFSAAIHHLGVKQLSQKSTRMIKAEIEVLNPDKSNLEVE